MEVKNTKERGLGMPLPAGKVRVYKEDKCGAQQFVGEDQIDHTPKNEKVRLTSATRSTSSASTARSTCAASATARPRPRTRSRSATTRRAGHGEDRRARRGATGGSRPRRRTREEGRDHARVHGLGAGRARRRSSPTRCGRSSGTAAPAGRGCGRWGERRRGSRQRGRAALHLAWDRSTGARPDRMPPRRPRPPWYPPAMPTPFRIHRPYEPRGDQPRGHRRARRRPARAATRTRRCSGSPARARPSPSPT